jgi:hypothetical protein
VGPAEHVDRVELEQSDLFDRAPNLSRADPAGRASLREALRGERDTPGFHGR